MSDLLIFDPYDNLLAVLSNDAEGACPFWNAPFREILNQGSTFEFTAPADHEDAQYLISENQVAFMDKDGVFRLFVIKEPEKNDGEDGPIVRLICEPAMLELNDEVIEDVRPYDRTAEYALTRALTWVRWQVGEVAELGINSTNFYYISVTQAILDIINTWGGELRDRVEIEDNKIVGRYIDILPRRGADTGKLWEIDKDIISITHKVQSYPKTALYGRGSSLEVTDEEGNPTGGYTRKINFADVEWHVAKGDPVDKPLGQEWIGDPEALQIYGRKNDDGTLRHRVGIYENGNQEDPETLLKETWEALQVQKHPIETYEMDVFLLEEISGYEHEKARLGDTTIALARTFARPVEIETRVVVFEYDVADPDNTGYVEMGQYIDLYKDTRLDELEARINEKSGLWDRGGIHPVTDDRFPDTEPPVPANFTADGLFRSIMLSWVYDASSYIAAYEVYGSQIQGFTPDASNLLWKGRTGGYVHNAETNQQWYFRIRTINHHGRVSPWSVEVTANTQRVISDDILFGEEIAAELRELSKTAQLLADGSIDGDLKMENGILTVRQGAIGSAAIANAAINKLHLQEGIVGFLQIEKAVITDELIAPNANIDFAKIGNVEITNAMITGKLDANKVQIGALTDFESGYDPSKIEVGSTNLLKKTSFESALGWTTWSGTGRLLAQTVGGDTYKHLVVIGDDLADQTPLAFYGSNTSDYSFRVIAGEQYTVSFLIRSANIDDLDYCYLVHGDGGSNYKLQNLGFGSFPIEVIGGYDYKKVYFTFKADRDDDKARLLIGGRSNVGYTYMYISRLKLEKGNKATDWTPAPEDVGADIAKAKADAILHADETYGDTKDTVTLWKYPNTTFIDGGALYNDSVTTNKLKAGTIDTGKIKIHGGTTNDYTEISGSTLLSVRSDDSTRISGGNIFSTGKFTRVFGEGETATYTSVFNSYNGAIKVGITSKVSNGTERITNGLDRSLTYSDKGVFTLRDVHSGSHWYQNSRFIDFFADETLTSGVRGLGMHIYSGQHLTVQAGEGITLTSSGTINIGSAFRYREGFLEAPGGSVIIAQNTITADTYNFGKYGILQYLSGTGLHAPNGSVKIQENTITANTFNFGQYSVLQYSSGFLTAPGHSLSISQNTVIANTISQTSNAEYKKNIKDWNYSATEMICSTPIREFQYNNELDGEFPHIGVIVQEAPVWAIDLTGQGTDLGAMTVMSWKSIQELHDKILDLENRMKNLE